MLLIQKLKNLVTKYVKKTDYDAIILEIEEKYFTTSGYNKFTSDILDAKIKLKLKLVDKSNNSRKISELNTKIATLATKAELKANQDQLVKHDLSYFLSNSFW